MNKVKLPVLRESFEEAFYYFVSKLRLNWNVVRFHFRFKRSRSQVKDGVRGKEFSVAKNTKVSDRYVCQNVFRTVHCTSTRNEADSSNW